MDDNRIEPWMSPEERMARFRRQQQPVEKSLRPYQRIRQLTEAESAELATLTGHDKTTRYRQMQDTKLPTA